MKITMMADFSDKIDRRIEKCDAAGEYVGNRKNHVWAGLFVLCIGAVLLLKQTGVQFPFWLFTWPVLIISLGILNGIKQGFRPGPWMLAVVVGSVFLADRLIPGSNIQHFVWPFIIMLIGFWIMVRPKTPHRFKNWSEGKEWNKSTDDGFETISRDSNDYLDTTALFGGIKKIILSKNFKGGDVVNIMGGTEINLTQADIHGKVMIEATNVFGGTKLIIPPTWDVQSNVVTIFGGIDDKRQLNGEAPDPAKVIYLSGTCVFGGIDIRSF